MATYNQQVIADGATVFWELHEASGAPAAADATSNGYAGTPTTGITFGVGGNPVVGSPGTATQSDGVAGHWISNGSIPQPLDNFTQEIWVNPTSTTPNYGESGSGTYGTGGANYLVKPVHSGSNHGVGIAVGTNAVQVWAHGNSFLPCLLNYLTTISGWTHIVVTVISDVAHLYVNGVLVRDSPYSIGTAVGTQAVGGGDYGGFNGQYCLFAQYPTALTATQIANHYSLGLTAPPVTGGSSGSSGVGNMLGSLFIGETMLGADPGSGGGGNGYGNTSNMLGEFMFGEPMLGADPSNGTGDGGQVVGPAGSVWQLTGESDGVATVTGDPARNNWPLAGTAAGSATVTAGLSAPVHLAAESDGNASFAAARLGTLDVLSGGEADGSATVTVTDLTDSILRATPGPAGVATVVGDPLGLAFNFKLVQTAAGEAQIFATFGGPVDLGTARADGLASLSVDLSVYLSGGSATGSATVTGDVSRHILAGSITCTSTVTANLTGDIFRMSGEADGSSSLTGLLGIIFQVAAAPAGDSTVTGIFYYLILVGGTSAGSGQVSVTVTVYNMSPQTSAGSATVVGDYSFVGPQHFYTNVAGDSTVVAAMRWRGVLLPGGITGSATVHGEVRRLWTLAGLPAGDSTVAGDYQIYTIPPGPIVGVCTVTTSGMVVQGHLRGEADGSTTFGTDARGMYDAYTLAAPQTSNGVATARAYLYDYPQDFEPVTIGTTATITGAIVLAPLSLKASTSTGVASFSSAVLGLAFFFSGGRADGSAAITFALLQINDAGLSRGSALVVAQVSAAAGGTSISRGFATFILGPSFTLAGDLQGKTVDSWSGVGTWHPGGSTQIIVTQEIDQPPPVQTGTDFTGHPIYGSTAGVQEPSFPRFNSEHINVGYWDGTYTYGPTESGALITDPETGLQHYVKVGALKRQFSLADPGQLGGWYVDTRSYRTRGPWGTSAGSTAVTADLFVEAKNALYGKPVGVATVTVMLLRLAARLLAATGNVALAVAMSHVFSGNAAKSTSPQVPIDDPRKGLDPNVFVPPLRRDRTMLV